MEATDKNDCRYILTSKARAMSSYNLQKKFKPIFENLNEYTESTTIHGMKYLGWKKPLPEKIYWIIIFVTCFVCLGFFIHETVTKWSHNFVILVEDDTPTPIHKIPFPAITICPQVKLKKSEFSYEKFYKLFVERETNESAYNEYLLRFQLAQQVCHYKTTTMMDFIMLDYRNDTFLNKSHIELLHKISPQLKDILETADMPCRSSVKIGNLKNSYGDYALTVDNFSTILTNEGVCFTLNMIPQLIRSENVQTEYSYNSNNSTLQKQISRVNINVGAQLSDMDSLCQPTQLGYKIILHSPEIYPTTFENFIAINRDSLTKIKVRPKMITTSESLRSYKPKYRQCFFSDERQLKFYKFYNRNNCKLECFANYTLAYYGCVHFAFPRSEGTPICGENINYSQLYDMVEGVDSLYNYVQEQSNAKEQIVFDTNLKGAYPSSCNCLSECNSMEYDYSAITETIRYDRLQVEISSIWNFTLAYDSPVSLDIFWGSPHFTGTMRKPLCTFSEVVSQFGGLLGLFMGASILSFFEIIYFCVRRQFKSCASI